MKKLLVLSAVSIFTLSSFTTTKKEVVKPQMWKIYCNGVYSGAVFCDCTQQQANQIAAIVCSGN